MSPIANPFVASLGLPGFGDAGGGDFVDDRNELAVVNDDEDQAVKEEEQEPGGGP